MNTMYPAKINSPNTTLNDGINNVATTIAIADGTVLPAAPNIATIGYDTASPETILYTGNAGNSLTGVTRGFQGTAASWNSGDKIARTFTEYDYNALRVNIAEARRAAVVMGG